MSEIEFWNLIDSSRLEAGGEVDGQVTALVRKLGAMSPAEIFSFEDHRAYWLDKAYDARLWAAGCILDELSDDGFHDFRAWLVSRGRDAFMRCLADPEQLASIAEPGDRVTAEEMNAVASRAYELKTGRDDFVAVYSPPSLRSQLLNTTLLWNTPEGYADPDRLRELYPRLWARFADPG